MMNWYVFYTPRGWAAIYGEKRTIRKTVLPTPSPLKTFHHQIKQTGYETRFVAWEDTSVPTVNKFRDYFSGLIIADWEVELDLSALSPFAQKTLHMVYSIPYGEVMTYGQVGAAVGNPGAARAVGQVMRSNPLPLIVPCHRVISTQGWGGFTSAGGPDLKKVMLGMEWQQIGRVPEMAQQLFPG